MASKSIGEIAVKLFESYTNWKSSEKDKDKARKEFFKWATENPSRDPRQEKFTLYHTRGYSEEQAKELFAEYYPAWDIKELQVSEDGYDVIATEKNEYITRTYTDKDAEVTIQKQVVRGNLLFDDERLKENEPELYEEISYQPETVKPPRQIISFDEMTEEQLTSVNKYMYEGKPTIKLPPPRKAKPEELE